MVVRTLPEGSMVNIGIIGCGGVVESLHLPTLTSIPDVKIKWVCDSLVDRARRVARDWGVGQAFKRVQDCSDVDAVLVATPVGTRRGILESTTARGWHALCEKPFAIDASEHNDLLACIARHNIIVGAGYMRRYYWAVERAQQILRSRVLGPLLEVVAGESAQLDRTGLDLSSYRNSAQASGGGVLVETGCHLLDEVIVMSGAENAHIRVCVQEIWNDYEVETIGAGYMTVRSGEEVALKFAVSGIRPVFQGIRFRCELGEIGLRLDPAKGLEVVLGQAQPHPLEIPHPRCAQHQEHVLTAFRSEWLHFLEAVRTRGNWDARRETGLLTSDVIAQCGEVAKASCLGVQK